jgi:hypothetical protein
VHSNAPEDRRDACPTLAILPIERLCLSALGLRGPSYAQTGSKSRTPTKAPDCPNSAIF